MLEQYNSDTRCLDSVYHVGNLDSKRRKPYLSYEGRGLSVSQCPRDWAQIMGHGGSLFELSHPNSAHFYEADVNSEDPRFYERVWAIENDYVSETEGFRIKWKENQETHYMDFYSRDRAENEAFEYDADVKETTLFALDTKGREYWDDAFRKDAENASPLVIRDLICVWFAENHGFCGVWWDENHNVSKYSAPRGVIFQSKLEDWKYKQIGQV